MCQEGTNWQYLYLLRWSLCPGLTSGSTSPVQFHLLGFSHFTLSSSKEAFVSILWFFQPVSLLLGLPVTYTGQCCFDLCLWIHFLPLVLVPLGNSFIWTQFYKSNRKITNSEVTAIVRDGPISFLSHCFFTGRWSWKKRWAQMVTAFIFTSVCRSS